MVINRIYVLLLVLTLFVPMVAMNFVHTLEDEVVCELLEDLSEEEEEDSKESSDIEESIFLRDEFTSRSSKTELNQTSTALYPNNNAFINHVHMEVQTPPPRFI